MDDKPLIDKWGPCLAEVQIWVLRKVSLFRNSSLFFLNKIKKARGETAWGQSCGGRQLYFVSPFAAFSFTITSLSFTIMPSSPLSDRSFLAGNQLGKPFSDCRH